MSEQEDNDTRSVSSSSSNDTDINLSSAIQQRAFSLISSPMTEFAVRNLKRRLTGSWTTDRNNSELTQHLLNIDTLKETKSTFNQATINGLNILAGLGIISLPFAFKQSGWLIGIIVLVYFTLLTNYTGKLIGKCMDTNKHIKSFPDLALFAFGINGKLFITIILSLEIVFAISMLTAAMADHLVILFPNLTRNSWAFISTAMLTPTALTDKLHILSYLSLIGIATTFYLLVILLDTGVVNKSTERYGNFYNLNFEDFHAVGSFNGIIYSLGLQMVGFAGHATFPNVYDSLADKKKFSTLLNIDYFFCFILYFTMAMVGYLLYTNETKEEITVNLYESSKGNILVNICVWTIIINPTTKFALMLNALASVFEDSFRENEKFYFFSIFLRIVLCFMSLMITIFLPSFAVICAFIGAFCSFIVSGLCPIACYLKLCKSSKNEQKVCYFLLFINSILCCLGTIAVFIPNST